MVERSTSLLIVMLVLSFFFWIVERFMYIGETKCIKLSHYLPYTAGNDFRALQVITCLSLMGIMK